MSGTVWCRVVLVAVVVATNVCFCRAGGEDLLPRSDECGLRSRKTYRVYYGEDAPLFYSPWLALLGYRDPSNPTWMCGGSLITERYVVSAAHCVHPSYTHVPGVGDMVMVRLGEHDLKTNPDCPKSFMQGFECAPPVQDIPPEEIFTHKDFTRATIQYDISLIRLKRPAKFGESVRPVCLPPADLDVEKFLGGREAVVAGWGTTEKVSQSKILQRAPLPFANKTTCEKSYNKLLDSQICFGGAGRVDSCSGDSGGPIQQAKLNTRRVTLLGIVSYGKSQCGKPGVPAVYTNVASFRNWIVQRLRP